MQKVKKIIYAAYGSNLLKERFLVYIKGGEFKGFKYSGCEDKNDPFDRGWMYIPHSLYFAKKSSRWQNGGVAFVNPEKEPDENFYTVVRLWEITEEQFSDIWNQEGKNFYNIKLFLGEKDGLEIYTLTGKWLDEINRPSEQYLEVIKKGLKETTKWGNKEIEEYINKFLK